MVNQLTLTTRISQIDLHTTIDKYPMRRIDKNIIGLTFKFRKNRITRNGLVSEMSHVWGVNWRVSVKV